MLKIVLVIVATVATSACAPFHSYIDNAPDNHADNSRQRYYIVQPNDNFYSIAFVLETTPGQLRRVNPWVNPVYVEPGTRLLIPGYSQDEHYLEGENNYAEDRSYSQTENQIRSPGYIWPLKRIDVSSRYGRRRGRLHAGIDLRAPRGTPIHASAAGRVIFSGYNRGYGHLIVIDHGGGIETAYAHNNRNIAKKGQQVKQGQVVATVGRSGNATGYHVHFEIRRHGQAVNPIRYVQAAL
jgi:murein DD-endopeptidase MepM/ murein hydrolase activator NlpD